MKVWTTTAIRPCRLAAFLTVACVLGLPGMARAEGVQPPREQLLERQRRLFREMPDRQVARFLVHPYQPTANAAAYVLAQRAPRTVPLLLALLKDDIPQLRYGALAALSEVYQYEGEVFRTRVDDPQLAEVLAAVRPLIDDPDSQVRRAVLKFVISVRVDSPDTREMLRAIARTPDIGTQQQLQNIIRHQLQDPEFRVELATISAETLVAMDNPNPGSLKVIPIVVTAHLDLCRPLIPACVKLVDKHALGMWGMFSNSPTEAAMELFEHFADDPRVFEALPAILRLYTRKVGGKNQYWTHLQEGPRRVLLRIGPPAVPVLREFLVSERRVFRDYAAGTKTPVNDWQTELWPGYELRFEELEDVAALIPALYSQTPAEQAVPLVCRIYLERDWSESERAAIRRRLVQLGPPAAVLMKKCLPEAAETAARRIDARLAAWQATEDPVKLRALRREIEPLQAHRQRLDQLRAELEDLAMLVETAHAPPGRRAVAVLARIYLRHRWPAQRETIRNVLLDWGPQVVGPLRAFLAEDQAWYKEQLAALAAEEAHCRATQRMGRGLETSLVRIALARKDLADDYASLDELALVIETLAQQKPAPETVGRLCRIFCRRDWQRPREAIAAFLRGCGPACAPLVRHAIEQARTDLQQARAERLACLSNTVKSRYKWRYDRACALEESLLRGIGDLEEIAAAMEQ